MGSSEDAKWFLADIVEEIQIAGEEQNVVHINTVLIRARSAEEAYEKAMANGRDGEHSYENTDGQMVTFRFRGLRNLALIHDELEDGAELIYEERIGVPEEELQGYITPKDELIAYYSGDGIRVKPNYVSKEVMDEVYAMLGMRPEDDEDTHDE